MCKFPHIGPEGTDVRHPDVINGTLAPAPISLGNPFRGIRGRAMGMANGGHFERHQHVQAMKAQAAAARNAAGNNVPEDSAAPAAELAVSDDAAQESKANDETSSNETRVDEQATDASATQGKSNVTRSVPNTRAGSPNSNFGNFRNGRAARTTQQNGRDNSRSISIPAGQREVKQKLPSADDFPALSGSTGSLMGDSAVLVTPAAFNGKTAAQVLSAPAPAKPAAPAKVDVKSENKDKKLERVSSATSAGNVSGRYSSNLDLLLIIAPKAGCYDRV
jgi:hypothetical protein